jgi:tRNA dimethylallyltransferase
VRLRLNAEADRHGLASLVRRLAAADPEAAARIHPNDRNRVIRALEVFELTGTGLTRLQREGTRPAGFRPLFFGLAWPRADLNDRIDRRVDRMFAQGLADEVRSLLEGGLTAGHNAMDSVGYKETAGALCGATTLEEASLRVKGNTRRFAKRQMTWFRSERRIEWIPVASEADLVRAAQHIVQTVKQAL